LKVETAFFHQIKINISMNNIFKLAAFAFSLSLGLSACRDVLVETPPQYDTDLIALTDNNTLLKLNASDPSRITRRVALQGLAANERLLAVDFRPATGQLYGVSSASRLYIIQPDSGTVHAIGAMAFTPALNGTIVGLDFNPTVDRIRLTTNLGQNLRLNPETGMVAATDLALNPANPAISEGAYINNTAGVTTTTLYNIDVNTDKLLIQNPPNNGTQVEVGNLGVNAEGAAGFDITDNNVAYAALRVGGKSRLYLVNLATGGVLNFGNSDFGTDNIIGLAIPTQPVAYALDGANNLLIFNPFNPQPVSKPIIGLQAGETLLGVDMRPVNGQLYALGSTSRLYTLNSSSGAATMVGTAPFATALNGTAFGFDFNPTVDRIRVVSNTGQNLRLHPETGAIAAVDGSVNPSSVVVTGVAYTNNFAGATTTTMYVLDAQNRRLGIQNPPNNGTVAYVGNQIPMNLGMPNGFDIANKSNRGYVLFADEVGVRLHNINLMTADLDKGTALPITMTRGFTLGFGF
jgi:Domain of unknown function (DUF4394)